MSLVKFNYDGKPVRLAVHSIAGRLDYIGRQINNQKTFWEIDRLQETLRFVSRGDVVFDCGANIGNHTVFWGIHGCKVYAFEPNAENFRLLLRNTKTNHCEGRNLQVLLGDASGVSYKIRKNGMNPGNHVYVPSRARGEMTKRLDDICFIPVKLVKIDVEGAEMRVLRGMERILNTYHPIVFAEYHRPVVSKRQVLRYLNRFGYRSNRDVFLRGDHVTTSQARALLSKVTG